MPDTTAWVEAVAGRGCKDTEGFTIKGLVRNYLVRPAPFGSAPALARAFDAETCAGAKLLDSATRAEIKRIAAGKP